VNARPSARPVKLLARAKFGPALVARALVNAQNEKVGNIDSVILGPPGHVDKVVIGGGFLGMGERDVAAITPGTSSALD
jgi:hypothetical protein